MCAPMRIMAYHLRTTCDRATGGSRIVEERGNVVDLIVLLLLFWVLGFAFDVAGGIIHVLLVIAGILFLVNLISGRRTVP